MSGQARRSSDPRVVTTRLGGLTADGQDAEARWWRYYDFLGESGPVVAARRATAAVFGVDPSASSDGEAGR